MDGKGHDPEGGWVRHRIVMNDGARLAVSASRPVIGATGAVLFIHGWASRGSVWAPVLGHLGSSPPVRNRALVIYDQRGHGESSTGAAPFDVERLGRDLCELLDALDLREVIAVGHSGGGYALLSALALNEELPTRIAGLVLVSTAAVGARTAPPEQWLMGSGLLGRAMSNPTLGRALIGHTLGPGATASMVDEVRSLFASTPSATRRATFASTGSFDARPGIGGLDVPAVVLAGRHDHVVDPAQSRELCRLLTGADLEFADAGHHLPVEAPALVSRAITNVAARCPRTSDPAGPAVSAVPGARTVPADLPTPAIGP